MTIKFNKKGFFDILKIGNKNFNIYLHRSGIHADRLRYGSQTDFQQNKD